MINDLLLYTSQVSVVFSLLFLPYFFLRNDTFFTRNRIYLMISVIISVLFPVMKMDIPESTSSVKILMDEISIYSEMQEGIHRFSFFEIIGWFFIVTSVLFFVRLMYSIIKISSLIIKNPKEKSGKDTIVWLEEGGDFSFFRYIFLSKQKYHHYILEHERVHAKKIHSVDILVFELFRCFQWFNPLVWMAVNEIKAQHEYEADELTAGKNKSEYQALLLSSALEANLVPMTNSFHCLTIKKRFIMMNKKRSSKKAAAKFLIVLPFMVFSFGIFAMNSTDLKSDFPKIVKGGEEEIIQPEYKGGMEALVKFLTENIKYPEKAKNENVSGKVYVSFVVSKSGKIKDVKVVKSVNVDLDAEALRVIQSMPDWNPGTKDGKKTDMEMTLPINFQL